MRLGLAAALVVLALASDARAEDAVVVLVTDSGRAAGLDLLLHRFFRGRARAAGAA